jgi:hypothetical protein
MLQVCNICGVIIIEQYKIGLTCIFFIFLFRDPMEIPWGDFGADYVIESSGVLTHLKWDFHCCCEEKWGLNGIL